ncbi:WD40 repeat-like protein [Rhizopogon salebrosus TDB-379]|nr:WD40 repeat-like protein [Rhizopogon salebrosus TDB-379]
MDNKLLASGSWNGIARIWSLDTGELVAGPLDSVAFPGPVVAVRFSHDSRKLAVKSHSYLGVWDIQAQKLDNKVRKPSMFWTTKDRTIVAAFCSCLITEDDDPATIYEFDSSTLETVGTSFEGHTDHVSGLALSNDSALLASASYDRTIKLWAFESRQLLASFDDTAADYIVLSPDSRTLAYTTFDDSHKIHICDVPSDILTNVLPGQEALATSSDATRRPATVRRNQVSPSFALLPPRPSPTTYSHQSTFIGHLRKHLPFSFGIDSVPRVQIDDPRDPLDSRPHAAASIILAPAPPSTVRSSLRHMSNWWPARTGHALPPIVDVPLAQGKERNAAAGARKGNGGYRRDEDFDTPPPPPNSDPEPTSALVQIDAGEHGGCCLCF